MHAVLLTTLLALGASPDAYDTGRITQSSADIYQASAPDSYDGSQCGAACGAGGCGHGHGGHLKSHGSNKMGGWFGHMPQTCYDPRYGCYYGGGRHMHRYPAFHGTFYRRPYNYRHYFEYPWHAEMHEPTSMFSYNVSGDQVEAIPVAPGVGPAVGNTPPTPEVEAARRTQQRNAAEFASRLQTTQRRAVPYQTMQKRDLSDPHVKPAATLRR